MNIFLQEGFLNGFYEILGPDLLRKVLGSADYAVCFDDGRVLTSELLPVSFYESLAFALEKELGSQSLAGVAQSAGRMAFKTYKDAFPALVECGSIEKRLLPFVEKVSTALNAFIEILNESGAGQIELNQDAQKQEWHLTGKINLPEGTMLQIGGQHFLMGVLENLLEWIDSRHAFAIDPITDRHHLDQGILDLQISIKQVD
jgi:hypothetical protein